jgi:methionyl-tRNA formyltransferase
LLFINAFDNPYQGALTFLNGFKVHLKNCKIIKDKVFHPFQTGLIYKKSKLELFVSSAEGTLIIKEVISEEGENIFNKIKIGERFYTPTQFLDKSLATKIVFTPEGKKAFNN